MIICRDVAVNPRAELTAIRDCSSHGDLRSSTERTSEDLERNIARFERTEESSMGEFCLDVRGDVLRGDGGGGKVTSRIFWLRRSHETEVPSIFQRIPELFSVEIALKCKFPCIQREGRSWQRNPERIHVSRCSRYVS